MATSPASPSATHLYGPYLQRPFPANPFNDLTTVKVKAKHTTGTVAASGWIAYLDDGEFELNATAAQLDSLKLKDLDTVISEKGASLKGG